MATALGQLLVQDGKLSTDRLEDAYQRQVLFGGQLDTILLEMGLIEEPELLDYLSRRFALPAASAAELAAVPAEVLRLLPRRLAERYRIVPLQLDRRQLHVACCRPLELDVIDDLNFMLSLYLVPHISSELRVSVALHSLYGLDLKPRYAHLLAQLGEDLERDDSGPGAGADWATEPAAQPAPELPPEAPAEVEAAPAAAARPTGWVVDEPALQNPAGQVDAPGDDDAAPGDWQALPAGEVGIEAGEIQLDRPAEALSSLLTGGAIELDPELVERAPARLVERLQAEADAAQSRQQRRLEKVAWDLDDAAAELALARGRDDIVEVLLRYAYRQLDRVAMFVVMGDQLLGWDAIGATLPEQIGQIRLPVESSSTVAAVVQSGAHSLGPLASDDPLLEMLGEPAPHSALLVPFSVRGRLVGVLYGDCGSRPVPAELLAELQLLMPRLSLAFEVVILRRKQAAAEHIADFEIDIDVELPASMTEPGPVFTISEPRLAEARQSTPLALELSQWIAHAPPSPMVEALVAQADAHEENAPERRAALKQITALRTAALPALARAFPGQLRVDLFGNYDRRPAASSLSAVIEALVGLGAELAGPVVVGALYSEQREHRAAALALLQELEIPAAVDGLCRCLLDPEARIALAAAEVCTDHGRRALPEWAVQLLDEQLRSSDADTAYRAVRASRACLNRAAIDPLIALLERDDAELAGDALDALREITKQDHGSSARRWHSWRHEHGHKRRVEWLLAGLGHRDRELRQSAQHELNQLSGEYFGYYYDSPKNEREAALERWQSWWAEARDRQDLP